MAEEVHIIRRKRYKVINNIFQPIDCSLGYRVRDGGPGKCDVGIIMNCLERNRFGYWHQGEPYTGIVVDLGAHIGGFTCAVAKTAKHVFAFEASTENFELLIENVEINKLNNVSCYHRAVGDGSPQNIVFCNNQATTPSTLWIQPGTATETIKGISLANIVGIVREETGDEIEFLKMDCEGGEYGFLGESQETIRNIKTIAAEIHLHPEFEHQKFIAHIVACNYRVEIHASRAATCKMGDFWRIDVSPSAN